MNISDVQILLYWKELLCLLYLSYNDIFWLRCTWPQALLGKSIDICGLWRCRLIPHVKALQHQLCPISSEFLSWRRFSIMIILMIMWWITSCHHSCGHLLEAKDHILTPEKSSQCLVPSVSFQGRNRVHSSPVCEVVLTSTWKRMRHIYWYTYIYIDTHTYTLTYEQ